MKAVLLTETGGPEKLSIGEVPTPSPGAGEVRVKLKAAALNRRDFWITSGLYPNIKMPCTTGSDGAGVIDEIGSGVDTKHRGREVVI